MIIQEQQGPHVELIVNSTSNSHPKLIFINLQMYIKNSRETLNLVSYNPSAHGAYLQLGQRLQHSLRSHPRAAAAGPAKKATPAFWQWIPQLWTENKERAKLRYLQFWWKTNSA